MARTVYSIFCFSQNFLKQKFAISEYIWYSCGEEGYSPLYNFSYFYTMTSTTAPSEGNIRPSLYEAIPTDMLPRLQEVAHTLQKKIEANKDINVLWISLSRERRRTERGNIEVKQEGDKTYVESYGIRTEITETKTDDGHIWYSIVNPYRHLGYMSASDIHQEWPIVVWNDSGIEEIIRVANGINAVLFNAKNSVPADMPSPFWRQEYGSPGRIYMETGRDPAEVASTHVFGSVKNMGALNAYLNGRYAEIRKE